MGLTSTRSCRHRRRRYVYQAGRIEWLAAFKRPDLVSVAELGLVKQPFLAFTALSLVRKSERTTTTTITIPFHGLFFRLFLFSLVNAVFQKCPLTHPPAHPIARR